MIIFETDRSLYDATEPVTFLPPSRHGGLTLVGIMKGEFTISIDYITHRIPESGIAWIMPMQISQALEVLPGTKLWVLQLTKLFMENNAQHTSESTPVMSFMKLKQEPFSIFEPEEFNLLYERLQTLREKFHSTAHLFHKEVVKTYLKAFMLDMAHFFFRKKDNFFSPQLTRKEELFSDFLSLLAEHCKQAHEVSFYAGKLCITPQYLSLILKEKSGRSASQWIQNALVVEAKRMLKMPRMTVQKVADNLNFPDQSTFGKFFKKHTGMSPLSFRKM
jgi:AraC-like DNA-binding protein